VIAREDERATGNDRREIDRRTCGDALRQRECRQTGQGGQ